MKKEKNSRLENSKECRRILNRYGVDLTQCSYTVTGREVCLTGFLYKTDGSDFVVQEIESMVNEFQTILRGFMVRGDMENWNFSSDHLNQVGGDEEQEIHAEDSEAERYVIDDVG